MSSFFQPGLLSGRSALITGGGTGICRGIALALASAGCNVAISSRNAEHLQSTADDIAALGVRSAAIAGDVRKPDEVTAVVDGTVSALGGLDIAWRRCELRRWPNLSPNGSAPCRHRPEGHLQRLAGGVP